MSGWFTVAIIGLALAAVAIFTVWAAARRWWDYAAMAALTVVLFPRLATTITGDVSRYVPAGAFSEGAEGKDQIVIASVLATMLLGVILSACLVGLANWGWRRLRR